MDPNLPNPPDQPQATPKQQVVERLKQASNVLVTVKSNPSVDELAATIGLTLMLNKLEKHATAVFSGEVPSTLEFLKPEDTIETNTDSLRDFIVSLDKSKADKLRYKVEENVVKIFITPYRTSITQDDLEFTQGDFNVDVVVALGVTQREELDQAITSHGRILHDATVVTVTAGQDFSELGQINWQESAASSLSEMLVSISEAFQGGLIDEQIATAFLTGIVSETERFSNPKTSPKVMTMAAQLMAAGANQQLIANELEKAVEVDMSAPVEAEQPAESVQSPDGISISDDGTLSIAHEDKKEEKPETDTQPAESSQPPAVELPEPVAEQSADTQPDTGAEEPKPPSENDFGKWLSPKPEDKPADSFNPLMSLSEDKPAEEASIEVPPVPEQPSHDGQIHIDEHGNLQRRVSPEPKHKVIQPLPSEPQQPEQPEPVLPPLPQQEPVDNTALAAPSEEAEKPNGSSQERELPPPPVMDMTPPPPIQDSTTIQEIEQAVHSPHLSQEPELNSARDAVSSALNQSGFEASNEARTDLNALPLETPPESVSFDAFRLPDAPPASNAIDPTTGMPVNSASSIPPGNGNNNPLSPPPVPPPMMPQ